MIPAGSTGKFAVGLTGGIGSGKSLIADEFARLGAHVVDADAIAHALTRPGGKAIEPIRARFGGAFVGADGALDRAALRLLVFQDSAARLALEKILHPMIRAEAEAQAGAAPDAAPYVLFVIPLLIESGVWRARVDRVLVIDCAIQTQIARVMQRSGLDEAATRAVISSQAARSVRLDAADDILVNEGAPHAALRRTAWLHAHYSQRGRTPTTAGWHGSL
ncbi:MAG: dephospho-CoA kinase [Gemmatimonadota bacterium]